MAWDLTVELLMCGESMKIFVRCCTTCDMSGKFGGRQHLLRGLERSCHMGNALLGVSYLLWGHATHSRALSELAETALTCLLLSIIDCFRNIVIPTLLEKWHATNRGLHAVIDIWSDLAGLAGHSNLANLVARVFEVLLILCQGILLHDAAVRKILARTTLDVRVRYFFFIHRWGPHWF